MSLYLSGSATAPLPVVSGVINGVNGAISAPVPTASGTLVVGILFGGAVTAPLPSVDGTILFGTTFSGAVRSPFPSANSLSLITRAPSGEPVAPPPSASGVLTASIPVLDGSVLTPFPRVSGVFAVVQTASGTALVLNLSNRVVSRYADYGLGSICTLNGVVYGASKTGGIYTIGGDDDAGVDIDASIVLGETDFGSSEHKSIPDLYLEMRCDGEMEVLSSFDEVAPTTYTVDAPLTDKMEMVRVKMGRGDKGGQWQGTIRNKDGADFNIQSIGMLVEVLSRRL